MRTKTWLAGCLALALWASPAAAQGKGQDKDKPGKGGNAPAAQAAKQQGKPDRAQGAKQGGKPDRAQASKPDQGAPQADKPGRGNAGNASDKARGNARAKNQARNSDARERVKGLPENFRNLERSNRRADRFVLGAAALGAAHGLGADALSLRNVNDRIEVRNKRGDVLFDMDEDRANRLGVWNLNSLGDREVREGAPAFCRSGEGHPVWGREWCIDKGFGLGRVNDRVWSRGSVEDIIFGRRIDQERYERPSLIDIVGDVVFGRLALHSLALGFDEPLVGYWAPEPAGVQVLRVNSGREPVAELVDLNGDNRVDVLYVTHR